MKKFKYLFLVIVLIIILTGCENDTNKEDKELIVSALQNIKVLSDEAVYVDKVLMQSNPEYPLISYDVYEDNGKYYAINFDRIILPKDTDPKNCKYVISVYDKVELLKDIEVEYTVRDGNTGESRKETKIKDDYDVDTSSYKEYCGNTVKKLFGKKHIELEEIKKNY